MILARAAPQGELRVLNPSLSRTVTGALHIHLYLRLRPGKRVPRGSYSNDARVTTIFAAFIGVLSMAHTLLLQEGARTLPIQAPLFNRAALVILGGAVVGSITVILGSIPS